MHAFFNMINNKKLDCAEVDVVPFENTFGYTLLDGLCRLLFFFNEPRVYYLCIKHLDENE